MHEEFQFKNWGYKDLGVLGAYIVEKNNESYKQIDVTNVKQYIKDLIEENQQLKEQLQQQEEEYDRMFALWHSRKLIKKFDDEFDEEDKKKNQNRDYACICPDAEEVYKRYYELKEQLKQKEDIINKAKDLIESYYDFMEEEYDFKYFDGYKLLEILDIDKGE